MARDILQCTSSNPKIMDMEEEEEERTDAGERSGKDNQVEDRCMYACR
jgi:hypothetical protein